MAKHPKGITVVATTAEEPFTVATIPVNSWSFAIRVWLATILALFVSFWLQLESPTTAALTVGILAEPTRGQALDKAGFRLLATVVGVTASIAISGLFAQARVLILAAFAMPQCCRATLLHLSRPSRSTLRSTCLNPAWRVAPRSGLTATVTIRDGKDSQNRTLLQRVHAELEMSFFGLIGAARRG